MELDYEYMALTLSNLSGIPVRLYRDEVFQALYHPNHFKPDLAILEERNIFRSSDATVSYYMTDQFLLFGLFRVTAEPVSFILGPVTQITPDRARARGILRAIGEPMGRDAELLNYLKAIPGYPLRNFLQILCSFDYFINGEKKSVGDLILEDVEAPDTNTELPEREYESESGGHNTYDFEQQMLSDVEHGRVEAIQAMMSAPAVGRVGTVAHDDLRQQKNILVCSATLVSRAAIRGGIPAEDAFSLSDLYIQKSELLTDYVAVMRLGAEMVLDFTRRVAAAHTAGSLSRAVRAYALQHISRRITTDELAQHLNLSRAHFCTRFKLETGQSVTNFITALRMDEAKRLLSVSKKPLGEIAASLGFSSQSHFQNAFKKAESMTPGQYRAQM